MVMNNFKYALLLMVLTLGACSDKAYRLENDNFVVGSADLRTKGSVPEGNLMATAIKEANDLDIVFYPSRLLNTGNPTLLRTDMDSTDEDSVFSVYPDGIKDQFIVGNMKGKDIREFLEERSEDNYDVDLQVAGMSYHIHYVGGWKQYAYYEGDRGAKWDDDRIYRVAVSEYYYFSGATFPSYKYRNGLGLRDFVESSYISAKDSLRSYLSSGREWPFLKEPRANVTKGELSDLGNKTIAEIQGESHRSPIYGHKVTTTGVVTAVGSVEWYPGGEEAFIQSLNPDNNPLTSEGLHLHFDTLGVVLELGDVLEVSGTVYEQVFTTGLGRTGLRDITSFKVLRKGEPLPAPIKLGLGGLEIPKDKISTYRGNLNLKPKLNLNDGVDFFEALEGMRVTISNPRLVGFRGGNEEFESSKPKGYLNLYLVADGADEASLRTDAGGIIIDELKDDFNPEIVQVLSNHFSNGIATDVYFNIGDIISGDITGVMGYEKNLFGGGDYAIVTPETQKAITDYAASATTRTELEDRPITALVATEDQLTVASYNVENLAGNQKERLKEIAKSISLNLKCPDILSLVEIQDVNGDDFSGNSGAEKTIKRLIRGINCPGSAYQGLNIDPIMNGDGGKPGGNIRVAIIYNSNRVSFTPRGDADALTETRIMQDGSLENNPGRIFPNDPAFEHTRKSLAAEFMFKGQRVIVIANHFNSKLGDASLWGAEQPAYLGSENRRQILASKMSDFVELLVKRDPNNHVIVAGDFNAHIEEAAMHILEGNELKNLMHYGNLVPFNDRYTTNYNGNSQAIDFIFASKNLLEMNPEFQPLHINTDYMGRLSDHDPVIARFKF